MRVTAAVEDDAERVALQLVERPHPRPVRGERVPGELDARASPVTTPRRCDAHDGDRLMCFFIPRRTHRRADPRQGAALESATPTTLGIRTRNHASPRVRTHRTGRILIRFIRIFFTGGMRTMYPAAVIFVWDTILPKPCITIGIIPLPPVPLVTRT